MFFEAHRLSIFTPRSLDVDVVLDLMIHDLDIVLTSPTLPKSARSAPSACPSSPAKSTSPTSASNSNPAASPTSPPPRLHRAVRKLRFFQPRQYVSIDFARRDLLIIAVDLFADADADAVAFAVAVALAVVVAFLVVIPEGDLLLSLLLLLPLLLFLSFPSGESAVLLHHVN
jgi:hypothetical protein